MSRGRLLFGCLCLAAVLPTLPAFAAPRVAGSVSQHLVENGALPAIETALEKKAASNQKASDVIYRLQHPEIYGYTESPRPPVRRFGEFEPVEDFLLSFTNIYKYDSIYGDMIENAWDQANLRILVSEKNRTRLENLIKARGVPREAVELITDIPVNSVWMRDYGPLAVITDRGVAFDDIRYYVSRVDDDAVPTLLAQKDGNEVYRPDLVGEGGNFFSNGNGLCFTTAFSLEQNEITEEGLANLYADYFGCEETHILKELEGNVIAHIDMFFHPVSEDTFIVGQYEPEQDPVNAAILEENVAYLESLTTRDGRPLRLIRVPMPSPVPMPPSVQPVYASYINFVAVNNVVLVPVYDLEPTHEAEALQAIQTAWPGREIVPIVSDAIAPAYGAIHCITQTTPSL